MQKKYYYIFVAILYFSSVSFSEVLDSGQHGSSGSRGAYGSNYANGGFGNPYGNPYGGGFGGGFGGMGGGFGGMGGMGGGGGSAPQKNEARDASTKTGQETVKKLQESEKQFSQSIEKLQQGFASSLDKLNPQDNTADLLKELNESNKKYSSSRGSSTSTDETVQNIVDGIATIANTQTREWQEVAKPFTKPISAPDRQTASTSTEERIKNLGGSNRPGNPLAEAISAQPASGEHSSIPGTIPGNSPTEQRGIGAYNPPNLK